MSRIFLNDDDVISMDPGQNFAKTSTSKIKEVRYSLITEWLSGLGNWMGDGIRCQVLLSKRVGWYKGKVRLVIEFVPDDPEAFADEPISNTSPATNPSPLDDLRSNLNV
jgi:hypothetical protein